MRRRDLITLVGGAAAAWPLAAHAQQPISVIGWLFGISAQVGQPSLAAFRKALSSQGYVEGRNVRIEYRWADGHYEKLPAMASALVAQSVALIVTGGGDPPALAAKVATATIPIVFVTGSDPVKSGLVPNLNRPGGNTTGASIFSYEMESKRLGLLHEAVPAVKTIGVLLDPAIRMWKCNGAMWRKRRHASASKSCPSTQTLKAGSLPPSPAWPNERWAQ
jgi:putative tryptophan/tyrosine transport system substrate-binding protein